ncbi:MAG: universal stress protein [Chloroflexi bacterium]|nr:universal stress protein [Chloroflexota bacterium]
MTYIGWPGVALAIALFIVGIGVGLVFSYLVNLGGGREPAFEIPGKKGGRILVPFTGGKVPEQALEVASNIARVRGATVVLFYIAIVPVTLNIEAELTREVEKGFASLEEAEKTVKQSGVSTEIRLERERTARRGIIEMLKREPFQAIVMEMEEAGPGLKLERQIEVISYLFQRVRTEIIIVRSSREVVGERGV